MSNKQKEKKEQEARLVKTVREKIRTALTKEKNGLSKARLANEVGADRGHFRNILNAMVAAGEVSVVEEQRDGMPAKICRLLD